MLWMMLPCLLLLGVFLFSGGTFASSGYFWLILTGICVVPHLWMMLKGHGGHSEHNDTDASEETDSEEQPKKDEHKHGGCCH